MRLLNAGKMLFAKSGYEQTSTAAIAREAGSSESQLIRYFGGKAGLLEAIFNESWMALHPLMAQRVESSAHGREAILGLLVLMMQAFSRDHDIAFLFLFEGRRIRGHVAEVLLSKGFGEFLRVLDDQIKRGQADGSFRSDIHPSVLSSAMLGAAEGMVRDRILSERNRLEHPFNDDDLFRTFSALVDALAPSAARS
ncbi:MAG: helix-turn-helix domain-containing protein [Acidobacteriota bacterium]